MKWYALSGPASLTVTPDDVVNLARGHRHAVLNILQVACGWLQLGRSDAALEYLERVKTRLIDSAHLRQLGDSSLEAAVVLAMAQAEDNGIPAAVGLVGSDPVYLGEAAAGRYPAPEPAQSTESATLAMALMALVIEITGRGLAAGVTDLHISAGLPAGRPSLCLRLPAAAGVLTGIEDTCLAPLGFVPVASADPGVLGLEWRTAAECGLPMVELWLTAGPAR